MIRLDIPEPEFWAACGTVLLITATSFIRFIRWQGIVMTKPEHDKICAKQQAVTDRKLDVINETLKAQNVASETWRTKFDDKQDENHRQNTDAIVKLATSVAVLEALKQQGVAR